MASPLCVGGGGVTPYAPIGILEFICCSTLRMLSRTGGGWGDSGPEGGQSSEEQLEAFWSHFKTLKTPTGPNTSCTQA